MRDRAQRRHLRKCAILRRLHRHRWCCFYEYEGDALWAAVAKSVQRGNAGWGYWAESKVRNNQLKIEDHLAEF